MGRKLGLVVGSVHGFLTVLSYSANAKLWLCACKCGGLTRGTSTAIRRGEKVSCGCYRKSRPSPTKTHGRTLTPEYRSWLAMKRRCLKPRATQFSYYGGRGIKVCARWVRSFEDFLADMGEKPSSAHSIDRIDNGLGYSPENCRWATRSEQSSNARNALRITHNGITDTAEGWARRLGVSARNIRQRLSRGWSSDRALTEPPHPR